MDPALRLSRFIKQPMIRSVDGNTKLEIFLVSTVFSLLAIRSFLALTGYPQLSGGGLHIAHVLLGGLLMMVSIVILLEFINQYSRYMAAFLGGAGFGAFIDELGKFITSDNDYFYQPTIALIYIILIVLYLIFQSLNQYSFLSREERLANVLEMTKEAVIFNLDSKKLARAQDLLEAGRRDDPLADPLREMLEVIGNVPPGKPDSYTRIKQLARGKYQELVKKRWFSTVVLTLFVVSSIISLLGAIIIIGIKILDMVSEKDLVNLPLPTWLIALSVAFSAILVVSGVLKMKKDRLKAYHRFKTAVLIQIIFTQVFSFYMDQMGATLGFGLNILVLAVLRYMISQEANLSVTAG